MNFKFEAYEYAEPMTDEGVDIPTMSTEATVELKGASYLPDVLTAFKRFLLMAGFTYVVSVEVMTEEGYPHRSAN